MSNLSQAEIDALLRPDAGDQTEIAGENRMPDPASFSGDPEQDGSRAEDITKFFTPDEIDALGEIGNICMGTSATTMNMLLGRRVTITTPRVSLYKTEELLSAYKSPFLAISVEFVQGLYGKNLLLLKDYDAALITDLLMGGEGSVDKDNIVLTDIHLSAVSEVMNQMMGSAATAMSDMMGDGINISPPDVTRMAMDEKVDKFLDGATPVVRISFDMEIEGLLKSKLLQIMSVDMARELIASLMHPGEEEERAPAPELKKSAVGPASPYLPDPLPAAHGGGTSAQHQPLPQSQGVKSVKPAQYQSFDEEPALAPREASGANFDLINDIPLQVTVELGKTKKNLIDILNFGTGSIIVLEKQAGELVDVIVNGKQIAKGEVVVIDENYGVRITELLRT